MWPFRKRPAELKPQAGERLQRVCTSAPTIEAADHLREDRTELFARDDTTAGAQCAMRVWGKRVRASGLAEFASLRGTIERGLEEITHDFQGRQTSGVGEGCTNRVNVLKRRCDGRFTVGRLFQRRTLDLQGDHLFAHT
jgi:transposase